VDVQIGQLAYSAANAAAGAIATDGWGTFKGCWAGGSSGIGAPVPTT
jgi:hypothetical protein